MSRIVVACHWILLFGLAAPVGLEARAGTLDWQRYTNARYGVSAEIPMALFTHGRAPDNGDGQSFRSGDGAASVLIYGSLFTSTADSFAAYRDTILADARRDGLDITYKTSGRGVFVYSGFKGSSIVYVKTIVGCRDFAETIEITYPAASKAVYDPIVARMSRSLTARLSAECPSPG